MRKQDDGSTTPYNRLSSSCSSIRSSNYSVPRAYKPSLTAYKYSPANYTPGSRLSTSQEASSIIASPLPSRQRSSLTTTNLLRATSASHKTLYSSPAAGRVSASANDGLKTTPYRGVSRYTSSTGSGSSGSSTTTSSNHIEPTRTSLYGNSTTTSSSLDHRNLRGRSEKIDIGPTIRSNMVHPTSSHIRSRSSSYRTINVSQFTQQARERAEREEKDRQYKEWMERETQRESELGLTTIHSNLTSNQDQLRKINTNNNESSSLKKNSIGTSSSHQSKEFDRSKYSFSESYPTSSTLTRRRVGYSTIESESVSSPTPPPPPPPPPPLPSSLGGIPRSVSAAGITSYQVKPTAKIQPFEDDSEKSCVVVAGFTGLRNIGNTCFMNAILQMLVNNIELREFFLNSHFKMEINNTNPLGSQGRLATAFADFMKQMWSGMYKAIEPIRIKEIVAEKASQFANFAQHDAHEFLSFLLDGLHEDVNRVKKKPLTGTVESCGRDDVDVANEAWHNHILRNDSIFVDLFHGQLKSHVQCPNCDRVSITFDPFVYLSVPFPKRKKSINVIFWPIDIQEKPIKITVSYSNDGTMSDVLSAVGGIVRLPSRNLRAIEVFGHRIDKILTHDQKASEIGSADVIYVFQVHDEAECNEEVIVLYVIQRQLYPNNLRYMCSECGSNQGKLKACDACYNAYYCSKECQLNNWSSGGHRDECRRPPTSDIVGQPLIISFPKTHLTHQHLYRVLEAKSRHSVTIFQPPQVVAGADNDEPMTETTLSVPTKRNGGVGAPPGFSLSEISSQSKSSKNKNEKHRTSPRRQTVAAEPRSKNQKMFDVRKLRSAIDSFGESIDDQTDLAEYLPTESYISINWINQRFGKEYITVGNRSELDFNQDRSRLLCSKSSSNIEKDNKEASPHLTQMLDLFSETERLKPEESWYCSTCKDHVEATKRLQLYRLPPILIIQLKRFVYTAFTHQSSMHRRSKDERTVIYPLENLEMSPFLAETAPKQIATNYDLTGVVCHSGSSYFGHYISMGRLADFDSSKTKIEWRQFDDSMVTRQSTGNVQTDDAYLLFYKLRDPSITRSIFKRHYSCDPGEEEQTTK